MRTPNCICRAEVIVVRICPNDGSIASPSVPENATSEGGTCFGDSGGPHFWQDKLIIVSVTSWGDAICRANDMTQRIDLAAVLDWLAEFGVTPA